LKTRNKPVLSGHLPALNSLRGLAVLLVFMFHAGVPGFTGAFIGVDIFFVLSGFLITILLIQEHQQKGTIDFRNFYMRRLLRLFPALFTLLTVVIIFSYFFFNDPAEKIFQLHDALITLFYVSNWTRAFDMERPTILGHCWSLSVEEQFYFLWPLILYFLVRRPALQRSVCIAVLLILSWGWRLWLLGQDVGWNRLYNGFDCRADMLLAGCLLASLWNGGYLEFWKNNKKLSQILIVFSTLVLISSPFYVNWKEAALYQYQYSIIAFATVIIILEMISCENGRFARMLMVGPLIWLGQVSYGFYLWHYPVIHFLGEITDVSKTIFVLSAGFITLIFTIISWYGVERFFQKYKKNYARFKEPA
jgi:peptidoglycan/LPS O-acetylase OafA/YrhL